MALEQHAAESAPEIEAEKQQLLKAEADIENGWNRLRNQEDLTNSLRASGHNTAEAERLVQILKSTLVQWERHRQLIVERIAYLQARRSVSDLE
jgi:hypothetical protein